jgi:hypothetical protein
MPGMRQQIERIELNTAVVKKKPGLKSRQERKWRITMSVKKLSHARNSQMSKSHARSSKQVL